MELTASKLNSLYEATRAHKVDGYVVLPMPTMNPADEAEVDTLLARLRVEGFTVTLRNVDIDNTELLIF